MTDSKGRIKVVLQRDDTGKNVLVVHKASYSEPRFVKIDGSLTACTHEEGVIKTTGSDVRQVLKEYGLEDKFIPPFPED